MKAKYLLLILVAVLVFTSCTSIRVNYGEGIGFNLLGFDFEYRFPVEEYQLISGSFPYLGEDMVFESWTKVDANSVSLVAFLPTGQTFAKIEWDGKKLRYESAFMPQGKYFAQYIVNDLQLCYAPVNAIEKNIKNSGMSITEDADDSRIIRTLKKGFDVVETISIEYDIITVENLVAGYRYQIETL